jgi:hypothetical protein
MMRRAIALINALALSCLNAVYSAAGVATATVTSQVKTVNTLTYTIFGKFFSKAGTDNFWTLSGAVVQKSSFQKYLLLIDSAGAASVQEGVQSTISAAKVAWTNVNRQSDVGALIAVLNAGKAIAGILTVATDAVTTFTPGTTLLGAAGITATYQDGDDQTLLALIGNEAQAIVGSAV